MLHLFSQFWVMHTTASCHSLSSSLHKIIVTSSKSKMEAGSSSTPQSIAAKLPLHPIDKQSSNSHATTKRSTCLRCKKEQSTIVVQTSKFCTSCFQVYFEGKVRTGLEQARICAYIRRMEGEGEDGDAITSQQARDKLKFGNAQQSNSGRILLGLSGGPNSRALLRMVREHLLPPLGYDPRKGKPHEVFAADVVYVDDSDLLSNIDRTEEVRQLVEQEGGKDAGLHFVPLKIQDCFDEEEAVLCSAGFKQPRILTDESSSINPLDALKNLFATIRPQKVARTALANARSRAEDLHRLLIVHLLRREAERRNVSCLLTGENATRRAIRTIEGLGRGQGHKLPIEEGQIRFNDVYLLRPLSDVTSKEVTFYLRTNEVESLVPEDMIVSELLADQDGMGSGNKASIGRLTESLINLLEGNVPGTISTVNRTSSKLVFRDEEASHYAVDEDIEGDSSEKVFEAVGPSMPLRRRKEPNEDPVANGTSSSVAELEQNVRGLGLGGQGAKVYLSVKTWPQFTGFNACPLCQMPAQRGLQAWRRALTVDKKPGDEKRSELEQEDRKGSSSLYLSDLLCYACNLLLDTPETTSSDQKMPLPMFVLKGAQKRLQEAKQ